MKHPIEPRLPGDGEVAEFFYLHLNTARNVGPHEHIEKTFVFSVDGKARPMLVMRALRKKNRDRHWFLVLPITSKRMDGSDKPRKDIVWLGKLLVESSGRDGPNESGVICEVNRLPDNLMGPNYERRPVKKLDPMTFRNILSLVRHNVLGGQLDAIRDR